MNFTEKPRQKKKTEQKMKRQERRNCLIHVQCSAKIKIYKRLRRGACNKEWIASWISKTGCMNITRVRRRMANQQRT